MSKCGLDEDDVCTSCKVCGYELSKIIKEFELNLAFDREVGIKQYPISLVGYVISVVKKEIVTARCEDD